MAPGTGDRRGQRRQPGAEQLHGGVLRAGGARGRRPVEREERPARGRVVLARRQPDARARQAVGEAALRDAVRRRGAERRAGVHEDLDVRARRRPRVGRRPRAVDFEDRGRRGDGHAHDLQAVDRHRPVRVPVQPAAAGSDAEEPRTGGRAGVRPGGSAVRAGAAARIGRRRGRPRHDGDAVDCRREGAGRRVHRRVGRESHHADGGAQRGDGREEPAVARLGGGRVPRHARSEPSGRLSPRR